IVGGFSGGRAITTCGELTIAAPNFIPGVPTDGDIYLPGTVQDTSGGQFSSKNPLGVVLHEYGHYVTCTLADQVGELDDYMNRFAKLTLITTEGSNDEAAFSPLRNTGESLADYFVSHAMGYTNYFPNDVNGNTQFNLCSRDFTAAGVCLNHDATFALKPT